MRVFMYVYVCTRMYMYVCVYVVNRRQRKKQNCEKSYDER